MRKAALFLQINDPEGYESLSKTLHWPAIDPVRVSYTQALRPLQSA